MKTTANLIQLLAALATGDAAEAIEDAYEALYPVSFDGAQQMRVTEDN